MHLLSSLPASFFHFVSSSRQLSDGVLDQLAVNASFSVDTFLFMSGLLVTYSLLLEKEKNKRVNWLMYYIHRIIR